MPSNKVWRGCLEEFERTHNKYSILFFQVAKQSREYCHNCQNLANVLTWATGPWVIKGNLFSIVILWGHSKVVCQSVKNVPLSSWMHQLQDPKRSGWNDSSAAPRDFAYALGMGFAGWGNRLWVQELWDIMIYYEYIIYDFQVCVNVFFFTLVASPIFHMSLTNWANRCFKTDAMDYDNSDPGNEPIPLDMISQ